MIYLVSPVEDLSAVSLIELYSGDGSITLEKNDIFNEKLANEYELDVPYILPFSILSETPSKYHPSRNLPNNK